MDETEIITGEARTKTAFIRGEYDQAQAALDKAGIPRYFDGHMASLAERIYCLSGQLLALKLARASAKMARIEKNKQEPRNSQ